MTDEQKYTELLKELAELLKWKNDTIKIQDFQISDLKAKLEEAEKEINKLKIANAVYQTKSEVS